MDPLQVFANPNWLVVLLFLLGVLLYVVVSRRRQSRRIVQRFAKKDMVFSSFGASFLGLESDTNAPSRRSGALILLTSGIYFRVRFTRRELFIPTASITYVGVAESFKRKPLHQEVLVLNFLSPRGKGETAFFRVPTPARWVTAIKASLLEKKPEAPKKPHK